MIKQISLLTFLLLSAGVTCGYSQSKLSFTGTYKGSYHPMDSILIEDINTGSKIIKYFPDTVLYLLITDINDMPGETQFSLSQNYPNPFSEKTNFNIYLPSEDKVSIRIFNLSGGTILKLDANLPKGINSFTFTGSREKMYFLSVKTGKYSASVTMINNGAVNNSAPNIEYNGISSAFKSSKKGEADFIYNTGDNLVFTGYMTDGSEEVLSDTLTDILSESKIYTFRFVKKNRILILMYHKITDSVPGNEYERNSVEFENDIIFMRDHNYKILSMEELLLLKSGGIALTSDAIILSFDDGYESNYSTVYPLLSKYKFPATFFLTTEWIETPDFMKWSEVWLMSQYTDTDGKRPYVMGSHTSSHPYLEQSAQYYTTHQDYLNFLHTELADSKTWISDVTGQTDIFLSLPYGDGAYNQDIINTAIEIGYKGIRTSVWNSFTVEKMNLFVLPALPVLSGTNISIIENYLNP